MWGLEEFHFQFDLKEREKFKICEYKVCSFLGKRFTVSVFQVGNKHVGGSFMVRFMIYPSPQLIGVNGVFLLEKNPPKIMSNVG